MGNGRQTRLHAVMHPANTTLKVYGKSMTGRLEKGTDLFYYFTKLKRQKWPNDRIHADLRAGAFSGYLFNIVARPRAGDTPR